MNTVHMTSQLTDATDYTLCGTRWRFEDERRSGIIALHQTSSFFTFTEDVGFTKCNSCPQILDKHGREVVGLSLIHI